MTLSGAVGSSNAVSDRQAGQEAAQLALQQVERGETLAGFVFFTPGRDAAMVMAGVMEVLGEAPLFGASSPAILTGQGLLRRTVTVSVLSGDDFYVRALWRPDYSRNSAACAQALIQALQPDQQAGDVLLAAADGLHGEATVLASGLQGSGCLFAGALTAGGPHLGQTFQIGGRQAGSGGLALGVFGGAKLALGVGIAHGWRAVGALALVSRAQGGLLQALNQQSSVEMYARWFGNNVADWNRPPLDQMVRLYPLAYEEDGREVLRAPLAFEADGSLRFNLPIAEGKHAVLMVGSPEAARLAAQQAAQQARQALGSARPVLALLFADLAYQMLFERQPGVEVRAVQQVLGAEVPLLGAYTLGQLIGLPQEGRAEALNQQIEVVLFGERAE